MSPKSDDLDLNQFKELPLEQLQDMMSKVQGLVDKRMEAKKKEALRKIRDIVKDQELSFDEVVNAIRTSAKRGKAPPIYRNPEKPRQTWSGKGEAPDWYSTNPDPESLRIPE
jgi:DNA-binding protein H-NS